MKANSYSDSMSKVYQVFKNFIFLKQSSLFSSTLILAGMVVIARLFGFLRYRILSGFFTKEELDIYFAAFRLPDLIFEILITGALTTTFIPFFIKYKNDKENQSIQISSIINLILVGLGIFIVIMFIFMEPIMTLITPGYSHEKIEQITLFARILLIGQLPFFVLGNLLTGISQAKKRFLLPAIAPILYNIAIILITLLFSKSMYLLAPVLGVVVGAFIFFIIQFPILFIANFHYLLVIKKTKELWNFFKVAVPRLLTVIIAQIEATIDLALATLMGAGSYTIFYFAQHLQLLPVGILGITLGQASLPYLTEAYQENNIKKFKEMIIDSILNVFFFTIPLVGLILIARTPIVRLFFGGAKFDWEATVLTAITLSYFAISIPLHSIYYLLTRCFYAIFDSRTPFFVSLYSILLNVILSLIFVLYFKLPVWSLGISFSIAISINTILLIIILYKKIQGFTIRTLIIESFKMFLATFISSLFGYYLLRVLDGLIFDTTRTINVFLLLFTTTIAYFVLYLFLTWVLNIREIYLLKKIISLLRQYQKKVIEIYTSLQ